MKTFAASLFAAALAVLLTPPFLLPTEGQFVIDPYRFAASGPSYSALLTENFEGTGYESGTWSETGTPDEDYTTGPLEGSQSLRINSSAAAQYTLSPATTDTDNTTTCFLFEYTTGQAFGQIALGLTNAGSATWQLTFGSATNKLQIKHSSTTSANSTITLSTATTYYLWIEYEKGTGSNGNMRLFINTSSTKPASPDLEITNGTSTNQHGRFRVGSSSALTVDYKIDRVRVLDTSTGVTDWPS